MSLQEAVKALRLVKSDLEETRKQRAALEAELETRDATIASLQSKVTALTMELEFYKSSGNGGRVESPARSTPTAEVAALEAQLRAKGEEVESLKAALTAATATGAVGSASDARLDTLEQERSTLLTDRKLLKAHARKLEQDLELARKEAAEERASLETRLVEFEQRVSELTDAARDAEVRNNNEKKVLKSQLRRMEQALQEYKAAEAEKDAAIAALSKEKREAEERSNATERETGDVAEQLALLQRQASRVAELEKELAVVQEESRCEAARLKDDARLAQEAWEAERRRLQEKLEEVAHLRAGLTAETEQLAAQLQVQEADARRLTIETTRLQALVTEKDEEMARVLAQQSAAESHLREQVSELTKRCTSLSEESAAEVERLKTLLAEGEAKLTAMQSSLADEAVRLQTEWAKVREEADARVEANAAQLGERVKELEEQLKQAHAEGERARSEAAETAQVLQAELAASRADAAASEEEVRRAVESASEAAERARSEADGEVTRLRQELERVQDELGKVQAATRDEMERLRSEAESERSRLHQECANATAEAAAKAEALVHFKAEAGARASELCSEIERLRSTADEERQQLKAELEDLRAAVSEARQGAEAAQEREAAQLKAELEQARAEHQAVVAALEAAVQARQDEAKQAEQAKAEVASMAALLQEREAELAETRAKTSAEAEEVRRDMEQLKAEAQGNAEQLDGLVREKVWLQQQLDKVRSELGLLRGGVEKDLKELQADLERARAEGEERVRQERGQAEARLRAQAEEIAALKEQLEEAEKRVQRAAGVTREAMIKLEAQARETKAKELEAVEELRLTKERLEAEVRTAREEAHHQRAAWEQEQQEAGERFAELQARLQVQEQEGERLRATLEAERAQASEHEQAITNMHAELRQRDVLAAGLRADLDKALQEGDKALQAVKSQLSEAEVALQAAHTDRQATEAIIEQLQKDKQALASDKKVLKVHIRKLEKQQQENMELSTDSSSTEEASRGQMDELKKALEVADKTRAVLQEQLESQQAQHAAALQQVMRDCEVHAAERQALEEERASLLQRVQELEAAHLKLAANEASPAAAGRLQEVQHELSEARTRASMAEEQATEAKARLEAAMAQTARSKEEVNSLTMQLEARVAEHSEEISRREAALSSMQQALAKAENQMRAAHDDYRRVNADLIEAEKSFRRQLDAKQDEMSELKENLARAMAQQLGPLAGSLLSGSGANQAEEMKKLVIALTLQVGELEAQKSVLKKQRSFIREESSAEDGLQEDGRCKELEAQVEGLRREVGDAKARAAELAAELRAHTGMRECAMKDAETARARVAELEAALAQARARESPAKEEHDEVHALSHELSQAKEDVQRLSARVAEGEAAKDVMAREIKALRAEVEALQSAAVLVKAETEKELESLRWAVTAAEEAVKEKEAWANELASELEAARSREEGAAADAEGEGRAGGTSMELAQAVEEMERLRGRLLEAEAALAGATAEQQELKSQLERLREALVRSEEAVSTLELAACEAKEEVRRLKAATVGQEEAALQANDAREMLEREMAELRRALEGAREEAESLKSAHAKCTTPTEEPSTGMLETNGGRGQTDGQSQATTDAPLSSEPGRLAGGALPQEDVGPSPSPSLQPDPVYGGPTSPPRPPSRLPSMDWVEEDEDLPVPPFGLHDPVIDQLFIAWTSDKAKLDYLRQWLQYIVEDKCTALPANFTPGLQLVNLPPEVKDGFLTLIVPMIKSRQDLQVKVFSRPSGQQPPERDDAAAGGEAATPYYDLRIRILNMNRRPSGGLSGSGGPLMPLSPQPGLRRTSSSSPSSFFAGLTSGGPKLFTAMPSAPSPTPATTTSSSRVPSSDSLLDSSDRDGPPSLPRKGLLASRVEERLALLQKQGSQGDV